MNIPFSPTDNLYKFMALVGTIIFILSLYAPYILERDLMENRLSVDLKQTCIMAEIKYAQDKLAKLKSIYDNSISIQKGNYKKDINKLELSSSTDEIKNLENEIDVLVKTITINQAESHKLFLEGNQLSTDLNIMRLLTRYSLSISGLLSIVGYLLWYIKVQKYQDRQMKSLKN